MGYPRYNLKLTVTTIAALTTACTIGTRIAWSARVVVSRHQQAVVGRRYDFSVFLKQASVGMGVAMALAVCDTNVRFSALSVDRSGQSRFVLVSKEKE